MPNNDEPAPMPAMPTPGRNRQTHSPHATPGTDGTEDQPIRLEPVIQHEPPQTFTPSEPVKSPPPKPQKPAIPIACATALCIAALIGWKFATDGNNNDAPPKPHPAPTAEKQTTTPQWERNARNVLNRYLEAERNHNTKAQLHTVTRSKETETLIQTFKPRLNRFDVVEEAAFAVKPLPQSFTRHGIHLMCYQRPDSLPDEALFRPIVPMRVKLKLDSPSFLELAAFSSSQHESNYQNICAFFKQHPDGHLTLDWPLFVQTRYRLLDAFIRRPHPKARSVFRLLVYPLQPTLEQHVYRQHMANHDWYHIHCPGYEDEPLTAAVDRHSRTGKLMKQRFDELAKLGYPTQALTAELGWKASQKNSRPVLTINDLICWEFYNLNSHINPTPNPAPNPTPAPPST